MCLLLFSQKLQMLNLNLKLTNSDTIFVIHEGTKVQLLETDGLWTHVAIVNGVEGWMPSAELKKL